MQAFLNDKKIKKDYLDRVHKHKIADEIVKGQYWKNGKGCAVGCTIHGSEHKKYEIELGIPEWLARVEDNIFEGLQNERAKEWPEEFLKAINVGADLDKIKGPFLIFVLQSVLETFDHKKFPEVKQSIDSVIDLWTIGGTEKDFKDAARAAYTAYAADAAYEKFADKLLELLRKCK